MAKQVQTNPEATPQLSVYQKMLLNEFQNKPEIMQLLKVIFNDYPQVILVEHISAKSQLKRKQRKSQECAALRMKMEAYIEERIARLAGIDVDKLAAIQREADEKAKAAEVTKKEEDEKAVQKISEQVVPTAPSEIKGESNE